MRKTCYVVTDAVGAAGAAVFMMKTEAESFVKSIILDKMAELNFAMKVFDEFLNGKRGVEGFRDALEELVVLAGNKNSTVKDLLLAWNSIFASDPMELVEAELYEDPPAATEV